MEKRKGSHLFSGKPGPGRPKGCPNKTTTAVKDMVIKALNGVGGQKYLEQQATANPVAFMTLVGKVIPLQSEHSGDVVMTVITGVPRGDTGD